MNRRYILIGLVALATTALGQPNPRLQQLEDCLRKQGYEISYSQGNTAMTDVGSSRSIARNWTIGFGPQGEKLSATAIDSIRAAFTDLSKEEAETHLYENHKDCADTIKYSVRFFDGRREQEQASFSYYKNCDDGGRCVYWHVCESTNRVSLKSFDAPAFEKHIQPAFAVLKKLKGAASYPVYWRHDKEYKDSLASREIYVKLGIDNYNYFLHFYQMEDGLHILSITSTGEGWMPKEWHKLKSWINGKKEYLKGAVQSAKRQAVADAVAAKRWRIDVNTMNTMRYGSRTVTPDFYLELRGDKLHSYLPYLGQARVSPTLSPSIGLNFEEPVLSYKESQPKSKKYTQIDIDVKTREDSYHYVIQLYDSGEATIRVRSLNRDPINFDGTLATSK